MCCVSIFFSDKLDTSELLHWYWGIRTIVDNQELPWFIKVVSHYTDAIMGAIASQITSFTIVYSTVYSDADQRKHQSSASLAFVQGIHRGPVNSPHKWLVTRKMFPYDDVIMDQTTRKHTNHILYIAFCAINHITAWEESGYVDAIHKSNMV